MTYELSRYHLRIIFIIFGLNRDSLTGFLDNIVVGTIHLGDLLLSITPNELTIFNYYFVICLNVFDFFY